MKQPFRSFIVELVRVAADPRTPSSVRCGPCSACCRSHGEIAVSEVDLQANPALQVTGRWRQTQSGPVTSLRRTVEGACVHLVEDRCAQYGGRPAVCRRFDCRESAAWKIDIENEPEISTAGRERIEADVDLPAAEEERAAYQEGFDAARAMIASGADAGNASFDATTIAAKTLAVLSDDAARDALVDFGWRRQGMDRQKLLRTIEKQRKRTAKMRRRGEPIGGPPLESWE